jgi:protein-tyrosine phosphatase
VIDFHCHILPGIDDGSSSIGETEQLLYEQRKQGTETVIATPHFYAHHASVEGFLAKREKCIEKTQALIDEKAWDMKLVVGAEVYYFPGMGKAEQLRELRIRGTDLILVELPFTQWTNAIYSDIRDIIEKQKLTVILAHIERYTDFQKNRDIWDAVFDLPVIPQLNAGSFLPQGFFRQKKSKFCYGFLQQHEILLGTDCHNMSSRLPNMAEGRQKIAEKCGAERLTQLDAFAERTLKEHETPAEL